jgi:hypothetical protein
VDLDGHGELYGEEPFKGKREGGMGVGEGEGVIEGKDGTEK